MIQAMICGVVLTSGAGMSPSGLIGREISVAYRRVRCSSPRLPPECWVRRGRTFLARGGASRSSGGRS
jgi:hypothetical protein